MKNPALKLFVYFALLCFVPGSIVYLLLYAIMPGNYVFGYLFLMFCYHFQHPFQYIAVVAVTYAIIATAFALKWPDIMGWHRRLLIFGIMISTIIVASVPGGVLWKIHDMQEGFIPAGSKLWADLGWGALTGLEIGWLIVALSIPYNIIGLILGYFVTKNGFKMAAAGRKQDYVEEIGTPDI